VGRVHSNSYHQTIQL